jgi:hypothetical protein
MTSFRTTPKDYLTIKADEESIRVITRSKFDSFTPSILGLGNIGSTSNQIHALSVMFDLEGFTNFCKQIDPQLAVPEFLNDFLHWLFNLIREETIEETFPEGYTTFSDLPFLAKFMGDGVLFLWDIEKLSELQILNIVVTMNNICIDYKNKFFKSIASKVVSPPANLRCGIARGAIYSVGDGNDFVGPCINMSARLQKLNSLIFCFSRRGLNPEGHNWLKNNVVTMKTDIRGIGSEELVCLLKSQFDRLSAEDKNKFKNP